MSRLIKWFLSLLYPKPKKSLRQLHEETKLMRAAYRANLFQQRFSQSR